jgi:hypothetical protein
LRLPYISLGDGQPYLPIKNTIEITNQKYFNKILHLFPFSYYSACSSPTRVSYLSVGCEESRALQNSVQTLVRGFLSKPRFVRAAGPLAALLPFCSLERQLPCRSAERHGFN